MSFSQIITSLVEPIIPMRCAWCSRRSKRILCRCCSFRPPIGGSGRCRSCCEIGDLDGHQICPLCRHYPLPSQQIAFCWEFAGREREILRMAKYRPDKTLCWHIAETFADTLPGLLDLTRFDLVVPMPSSRASLRRRGFNQCRLLGEAIARQHRLRSAPTALLRQSFGVRQAGLRGEKRLSNSSLRCVAASRQVNGRSILLVDDVMTSGATAMHGVLALLRGGAASVSIATVARSARWGSTRDALHRRIKSWAVSGMLGDAPVEREGR